MHNGGNQVKIGYSDDPKRRKERIIKLNAREPDIYVIILSLIQTLNASSLKLRGS